MEVGYSGFTMDDISSKTGISKATIYKYFPGKHDLIKGLVNQAIERKHEKYMSIIESGESFIDCLLKIISIERETVNLFQSHILRDLEKNAPDILDLIRKGRDRKMPEFISGLLSRGQKENRVRDDIRSDLVAHAIHTLTREFTRADVMDNFHITTDDLHFFLIKFTFTGILTNTGKKELEKLVKK